jgi:hypothetical protein
MRNVLADLALESEAACALAHAAGALLRPIPSMTRASALLARVLTPVSKFWICKRGSHFAQEAMECLGGNGYVEEGGEGTMARIYREMPLNSIWEGAGNIMAIDLLRALRKADTPRCACWPNCASARGTAPALDRLIAGPATNAWTPCPPKPRPGGSRRTSRWRCRQPVVPVGSARRGRAPSATRAWAADDLGPGVRHPRHRLPT